MKTIILIPAVFVLLIVLLFSGTAQAQTDTSSAAFINWAKSKASPIQSAGTGVSDLTPLKAIVGDAHLVALGEAAHGIHEMLLLRNRIFQYMVEQMGFTTIVLEAGLAESQQASAYVSGSAPELTGSLSIAGTSSEDKELFNWMRMYNSNPAHKKKLKLYGMDMQIVGFPGDTLARHVAIDQALAYLTKVDAASAGTFRKALAPFLNRLSNAKYPLLSPQEHDQLSAVLDDLIALFQRQQITFQSQSSKEEYEWAYRNAVVARQTDRIARLTPPDAPGKIPADGWKLMNMRDASMAENIKWIMDQEGPESRILLYAHNAHIKNDVTKGSVWDAFAIPPNAAGQYLRSELGNDLVIIGTSFPSQNPPQPQSLDVALAKVGMHRFILDLRAATANAKVTSWLKATRPMQANMFTFLTLQAGIAFDALIFINDPLGTEKK